MLDDLLASPNQSLVTRQGLGVIAIEIHGDERIADHHAARLETCRVFAYMMCRVFAGNALMRKSRTLKQKIEYRMARRSGDDVFLPREFTDLAGDDQVLRALRTLVKEGRLMRLGYGVYARAVRSRLSDRPMVDSANGFYSAALQALTKLGVRWEHCDSVRAYNEGRATQIPVNPAVNVKSRFRRRLSDGRTELRIER